VAREAEGVNSGETLMGFNVYLRQAVENGKVIFPGNKEIYGFCQKCTDHKEGDKLQCLQCLRSAQTAHDFAAQYFNDPTDVEAVEFKPSWVRKFEFNAETVSRLAKTKALLSFDGATTLGRENDYTGIAITKRPDDQMIYVVEAAQRKLNPDEAISWVFQLVAMHNVQTVLVDVTSSQRLWLPLFRQEMIKRNKFFTIQEEKATNRESKPEKIRGLIPFYANGRVLHRPGLDTLEDQLLGFPRLVHDDVLDALAFQWKYWTGVPKTQAMQPQAPYWSLDWFKKQQGANKDRLEQLFGDLRNRG
jgi:phage terminase large subunit-like protein